VPSPSPGITAKFLCLLVNFLPRNSAPFLYAKSRGPFLLSHTTPQTLIFFPPFLALFMSRPPCPYRPSIYPIEIPQRPSQTFFSRWKSSWPPDFFPPFVRTSSPFHLIVVPVFFYTILRVKVIPRDWFFPAAPALICLPFLSFFPFCWKFTLEREIVSKQWVRRPPFLWIFRLMKSLPVKR